MRRIRNILAVGLLLIGAQTAYADPLNNLRTSSQLEQSSNPALYNPINLLDTDPATIWCEGAPGVGEGESIRFFFKVRQRIDRVVIVPSAQSGRIVEAVQIDDGNNTVRLNLKDQIVDQQLSRPLEGTTFEVSINRVGRPNSKSTLGPDVACLADVLLYFKNRLFGGKANAEKFRYDPLRDRMLGPWNGEPLGAPEKFLDFSLDGTWVWSYKPLLGGENERLFGEYRFRGNQLLMRKGEIGRWKSVGFVFRHVTVDPDAQGAPKGDYDTFHINGEVSPKLAGDYDNAVF